MIQAILRSFDPKVYDLIQPYRVKDDKLMPLAYQNIPGGRPKHDDWAIFKGTKRIDTAYRVYAPFKCLEGPHTQEYVLWDPSYPTVPGTVIEDRPIWDGEKTQILPHALIDRAIEAAGASSWAVWLPEHGYVPCFKQYRKPLFGRIIKYYSGGLKLDSTVSPLISGGIKSDLMGWLDPPSLSWSK